MATSTSEAAKRFLADDAKRLGFCAAKITDPSAFPALAGERLTAAIAAGHHGTMGWLADTADRRRHPNALMASARSVLVLAMNYGPTSDPMADLSRPDRAVISVYARNRDYHDVMKGRMKTLAQRFVARFGGDVKVFVDTAPVMEKTLAEQAGVGWQGKHTNLVSRSHGSWLFLGALFTTLSLTPDTPHSDHCGSCRRCLDICPTDAFPAPYRLDARRCLSYLTIEAKDMIPHEFREPMGNRIYGCDDCLAVCPWNRFAKVAEEVKLAEPDAYQAPTLAELAGLDDAAFRTRFSGSPIKRIGRERFVRNVMIAIGNASNPKHAALVEARARDEAPQVRAAAAWAAARVLPERRYKALAAERLQAEQDPMVRAEWMVQAEGTV
ncbi:MAG: tRNA epoxyqueuosine(34) reductase QueG [Pseudomonadota bacterium]